MYFPYLRGKQFELEALLGVPATVFSNTLPILEPVNTSQTRLYLRLAQQSRPMILIMNPQHPQGGRLSIAQVQTMVDTTLAAHTALSLGFILDPQLNMAELNTFLTTNPGKQKAVIFRYNPLPADLLAIQAALAAHPVQYLIFDEKRTNPRIRSAFSAHPRRVLITDGFQRQEKNANYPSMSAFDSYYNSWRADGWSGIGDYLSIGDHFAEGGGGVYVVALHITVQTPTGLVMHHFSSTVHPKVMGLPAPKFAEANGLLNASPVIAPLRSTGLDLYRDWHARGHNPQLGAAKKASLQHHIELLSSII